MAVFAPLSALAMTMTAPLLLSLAQEGVDDVETPPMSFSWVPRSSLPDHFSRSRDLSAIRLYYSLCSGLTPPAGIHTFGGAK